MSSLGNVSKKVGGIFEAAQLNAEKFYAKAFVLNYYNLIQQDEIEEDTALEIEYEQTKPRKIGELVESLAKPLVEPEELSSGNQCLGKNLLDSFALIFAQPGSAGVTAAIMELSDDGSRVYTLRLATNRGAKFDIPEEFTENIEAWFTADNPRPRDVWADILKHCHPSADILINNTIEMGLDIRTRRWIKTRPREKHSHVAQYNIDRIIELLEIYQHPEKLLDTLVDRFDNITRRCFWLLEFHEYHVRELFNEWIALNPVGYAAKCLKKLRRFIYAIANYRRALYDFCRFKTQIRDSKATLEICRDPVSDSRKSHSRALERLAYVGSKMGILKKEEQVDLLNEYRASRITLWVHCEMQALSFLACHDNPNNFFDYIGCSKCPCWLCYHTLKYITSKFEMRKPSLKLYAAWYPPKFQESSGEQGRLIRVLNILDERLKELTKPIMEGACERRWRTVLSDCPDVESTFVSPRSKSERKLDKSLYEDN